MKLLVKNVALLLPKNVFLHLFPIRKRYLMNNPQKPSYVLRMVGSLQRIDLR